MKLKKNILKYLVLGPSVVGLIVLGWNVLEDPEFFSSFVEGPGGVTRGILEITLSHWMLGLFVFPIINFIYYLSNRITSYFRSNLSYFLLYPIPFFIVLIGWTFYKEEGLPTDAEFYVGAYLIALISSFVFLFARARWRAATQKQKKNVIVGQLTTTVSFAALDIFLPTGIAGAIQGPEAFTGPWFIELILSSFVGYWLIYMTYKFLYFYTKQASDFNKTTSVLYKEAKVNAKEELKNIRAMHKISQGEFPDEDYIKETLSPLVKSVAEVVSEELSTNADQTSKKDKT